MENKGFRRFLPLAVACFVSVMFLLLGFMDRQTLLDNNPCKMTYASRDKTEIELSVVSPYLLWKVSNAETKKLNPQPVLFIHGFLGSPDQGRSLASHMHNHKGHFQYFAVDFSSDVSGLHGSAVWAQAAFTNEALAKIAQIYNITENSKLKIIVVAHSLGGIVARSAVMLNNHPGCVVSDIMLLGSPNTKAPFVPDASMDLLFAAVNKAWILSFYNTSQPCQTAKVVANLGAAHKKQLAADFTCPICASKIRLVSISGGDIDLHVAPSLTTLNEFTARPRNISLDSPKTKPKSVIMSLTSIGMTIPNYLIRLPLKGLQAVSGLFAVSKNATTSSVVSNSTVVGGESNETVSVDAQVCNSTEECSATLAADAEPPAPVTETDQANTTTSSNSTTSSSSSNSSLPRTMYSFITREDWDQNILPYVEPQFLSVRTSQMKGVGFSIDHAAMMWCHQLLETVTKGMTVLSNTPRDELVDFATVFPLIKKHRTSAAVQSVQELGIEQLTRFIARNDSLFDFHNASRRDAKVFQGVLKSEFRGLATEFFTRHLVKIGVCYMIVSLLALSVFIVRASGNLLSAPLIPATSSNLTLPWVHLNLEVLYPALLNALQGVFPAEAIPGLLLLAQRSLLAAAVIKVLFDSWWYSSTFASTYTTYLFWVVSYFVALTLRSVILLVVYCVRAVLYGIYRAIRFVLRLTVWNKFIRQTVRKGLKSIPAVTKFFNTVWSWTPLGLVAAVWMTIYIHTNHRISAPGCELGAAAYGLSVLSIVGFVTVVVSILLGLLWSPYDSKTESVYHHYYTELLLLYLPSIVLAWPSYIFAVKLLFDPISQYHRAIELYGMFGPERIHYCLCLVFISWNLYKSRSKSHLLDNVKPLIWLEDLIGPQALSAAAKVHPNNASTGMFSAFRVNSIKSSSADCVHEDGGINAIFEQIDPDSALGKSCQSVCNGVLLGPTFRVVHCSCATNLKLKFQSEWCEWCLCRKCGGKNLPREFTSRDYGRDDGASDFSVDLLHLFGLFVLAGACFLRVEEKPYLSLYFVGIAAAAHVLLNLVRGLKISGL